MNGATTDPCDNTIKLPNKTKISIIGNNQYFFLILRKHQNSFKKLILKLIF